MYFVYLAQCADGSFYCGITTNIDRRVKEHNSPGKGAKYTRHKQPVCLVYSEECSDRSSALKREWQIKKMSREEKEKLIT